MKGIVFIRMFFILICTLGSYLLGGITPMPFAIFGFIVGVVGVSIETFARRVSLRGLSSAVFGIILGLLLARLAGEMIKTLFRLDDEVMYNIIFYMTLISVYFGLTLGLKGRSEFSLVIPYVKFKRQELKEEEVVVDTSSIIDGRIIDTVKTGFLEVRFIIPRFVLNELHVLSDSTDHLKRQKGKRGIEILHELRKESNVEVEIIDDMVETVSSVDDKLVKLAANLDAKILTTDYNLNRIAQLQGVKVLNINDLANALKPTFIAGEKLSLKLIKEGKEHNQAVGYLDDGTMVVVENARWFIGKKVNIEVTSILQNPSGRIVFTKLIG